MSGLKTRGIAGVMSVQLSVRVPTISKTRHGHKCGGILFIGAGCFIHLQRRPPPPQKKKKKKKRSQSYSARLGQKEANDKSGIIVKEQNASLISTDVNGIS